jgi:hypothetical protein
MNHKLMLALVLTTATTLTMNAHARKPVAAKVAATAPVAAEVVVVDVPPPSGTWEKAVAPANGYIWSGGYYEWKDGRFAWKPGEWVLARAGMEYRQHHWIKRADGKYVLAGGDWGNQQDKVAGKP